MAVANVVKTSFGPVGLDKMLVNDVGDVLVTNDGATILQQLDIKHAAAKVLVELATLQDREVGDGTTSVVILASELLRRGNILVQRKLHPTCVIAGFRLAAQEATRYAQEVLAHKAGAAMTRDTLMAVARTSLASKVVGHDADPDLFAALAVDALRRVTTDPDPVTGAVKTSVKAVNILKAHGASTRESVLVEGYALNCTGASQAMPKLVRGARIACLDMNLQRERLAMSVQVLVTDPDKLAAIRKRYGHTSSLQQSRSSAAPQQSGAACSAAASGPAAAHSSLAGAPTQADYAAQKQSIAALTTATQQLKRSADALTKAVNVIARVLSSSSGGTITLNSSNSNSRRRRQAVRADERACAKAGRGG